ncbi:MAG TPA: hypothetical protein VGC95_01130, partial [Chitinophagaceae bacterium]
IFYDLFKDYRELKAETLSSSVFVNDGKGHFTRHDLPQQLQLAPLMCFADLGGQRFLAAGNFYGVTPYEGRYDAQLPTVFSFNRNNVTVVQTLGDIPRAGEARDAKWVQTSRGQMLALARNNDSLLFFKPVTNQ